MNTLERNKEIIHRRNSGEKIVDLAKEYGISVRTVSVAYYDFEHLVDRPFYDLVAGMGFSDQIAVKLANALYRYEGRTGATADADHIKVMDRMDMVKQRSVGRAVMDAFDKLQEAVRDE